jgi:hypothetical protein
MMLRPVPRYTLARRMAIIGTGPVGSPSLSTRFFVSATIRISLAAMISQVS